MNESSPSSVRIPQIRFPKGGGSIKGIGETFQPSPFTGTASFSIPITTPEARDLSLDLSLSYGSGSTQGPFGMGFGLSVPNIARRTEKRLPNYSEQDEYVLSNAEYLVPALEENGGDWVDQVQDSVDGGHRIQRYRTRTEGRFLRVERWTRRADGDVHWRVTSPENITSIYGETSNGRIHHPDNPGQIFQWLLERTEDSKGNRIRYTYRAEDTTGIANTVYEQGRAHTTQRYLQKIQYGNFFDATGETQWAFSVVFDYGDYDLDDLNRLTAEPSRDWLPRQDAFSDYRAGFEVRTHRLCRNILVFHHFPAELGQADALVRSLRLIYDESPVLTFLRQVEPVGYRRQGNTYEVQASPPISFEYSQYEPTGQSFQPLQTESPGGRYNSPPLPLDASGQQLIDLYGEGIVGLLYDREGTSLYYRPRGNGTYGIGQSLPAFPIERNQTLPTYRVTDGTRTRLDVRTGGRSGHYRQTSEQSWQSFQPFRGSPTDYGNPAFESTDVTGDGRADLLLFEADRVKVYPRATDMGHEAPITALRAPQLPIQTDSGRSEVLVVVDMVGDGLSDRVRVRNGEVTYWPNLGYGNFGAPVVMANAPHFEQQLSAARLYLTDIDGSGTADLIYVAGREAVVYFNESGNRFSPPTRIPLPAAPHSLSQIQFADIRGNGTSCLVFSDGTDRLRHQFYDFTGGRKPHLLQAIDNHRGAVTRIQYAPSTQFYLADRLAGRPWLSRLPFPVQVIEKTETLDLIAKTRQVSRYAYHHGAYDFREREFAGFGLVERWDTEGFEQFSAGLLDETPFELLPSDLHAPPIHTKTWFHTGLMERDGVLSRQYEADYYGGDGQALDLADSNFERAGDAVSVQVAYRALRGKTLRQEIYGDDDDAQRRPHPYQVTETAYRLRLIQPTQGPHRSVYLPLQREQIVYQYDRDPADPRITHNFYLVYDDYGQLTREANVAYPRRRGAVHGDQRQLQGRYTYRQLLHLTDETYRLNVPIETRQFELGGLRPNQGEYITWDALTATYPTPEQTAVDFDQTVAGVGARLLTWQRFHYWNDFERADQARELPFGRAGRRMLLRRVESVVYSVDGLANLLPNAAGDQTAKLLSKDPDGGAFVPLTHDVTGRVYYADPGNTAHYQDSNGFYQPRQFVDQFDTVTTVAHAPYSLVLVRTEAHLSPNQRLTQVIEPDYWTLKAAIATDENDNITEYGYDPLGNVRLTSRHGQEGNARRGDRPLADYRPQPTPTLAQLLDNPAAYVQGASSFFFYDLLAWDRRQQPAYAVQLQRERFVSDLAPGETSPLQIQLDYTDGLGRSLQSKRRVEAGPALRLQPNGTVQEQTTNNRWLTSGRTVYNNKGQVIKQYEAFYSDTPNYQAERLLTEYGVTAIRHYDPLGRVFQTDLPKGFLNRTEYGAWQVREFDANDTIRQAPYFQTPNLTEAERDALTKAEAHRDTPLEQSLDIWGRPFLNHQWLSPDRALTTYQQLDISGNVLQVQDPRLFARGQANFEMRYDMAGRVIRQVGVDIGTRWTLVNAGGDEIQRWDGRGFHHATHYDALSRPIELWVMGNGLNHQLEAIEYGETAAASAANNLRGRVRTHADGAGRAEVDRYDFAGNALVTRRRLRQNYRETANWSRNEPLGNETWTSQRRFDALNRLVTIVHPDNRRMQYAYHPSGRLRSLTHQEPNRPDEVIVSALTYNARDQRLQLRYGNGAETTYTYDPLTFNLAQLSTTRPADGRRLQDLDYTYDPAGNITRIRDRTSRVLFQNNQVVLPQLDYTYDALYRLTLAQGREHRGLYRPANALRPDDAALLPIPANTNNPQALENYSRRFTYDDANNLTQIAHTAANRRFTRDIDIAPDSNRGSVDTGNLTQSYDANGNLTRLPQLRGMEWNSLNQLAAVDVVQRNNGPNDGDYYSYDASGQRVRKVLERQVNGALVIEETLYFGDYELHRVRRGNQVQEAYTTVHAADGRSRIASLHRWTQRRQNRPARQTRYQLDNHQTSVSLELDGDGRILTYEEYFPYGGIAVVAGRSQQEVTRKRYRYAGRERDATTQLYYYGSRYYAPWMGRWLSPDPAGAIDGANVYGYVKGNPVNRIDADGQVAVELNNQGQVARQRQFFENLIQGTANPDPPTRTNARRVLDLEKQILIPSGIVAQRIKTFEALEQAANNPVSASPPTASPAANNSPRRARSNSAPLPGAAPSSGASGNANGSSNNRRSRSASAPNPPPAPPAPPPPTTRPRSNAVSDNPTTRPRSNAISQGPTVLNVATDRKTAVLLAAAIIVAVNLIKLERQRRDVVQEVKGFDRSQLNPVTPRIADNPDLGRVLDDPSPVDSDLNESASESASEASASESSSGADDLDDPVDSVESESANDAPQVDQTPAVNNRSRQNNL